MKDISQMIKYRNETLSHMSKFFEEHKRNLENSEDINLEFLSENYQDDHINENIGIFETFPFMDKNNPVTVTFHPPNSKVSKHRHNFFEIIFVYSGNCKQWIEGKYIELKTGDICILNTKAVHSLVSESDDDIIINILMGESMFHEYFMKLIPQNDIISKFFIESLYIHKEKSQYLSFEFSQNDNITNILDTIVGEYANKKLGSSHVISCYMGVLFCEILRAYRKNLDEINYEKLNNTKISDILTYIEDNYAVATLKSTSEHFFFHPNYLSSLIKKTTNRNFSDILRDIKLKQACYFLTTTSMSVDEVARQTGYANISFFYRIFKASFDVTPFEYRKNFKKNYIPVGF